jgi:hypothetical protein
MQDITPRGDTDQSTLETIPPHIREQVTAMLHDFVSRNVEDA